MKTIEKSNIALISQNNLSNKNNWVYIGSVATSRESCYTETLIVDSSESQFSKFKYQTPAILKSAKIDGEVTIENVFTDEEQMEFIELALEDFSGEGGMNFTHLLNYYNSLKDNNHTKRK